MNLKFCRVGAILVQSFGLLLMSFSISAGLSTSFLSRGQRQNDPAILRRDLSMPPPQLQSSQHPPGVDARTNGRRSVLQTAWTIAAATVLTFSDVVVGTRSAHADTGAVVRGTPVNAFNGLTFQYRGSDFDGLRATDVPEPSISYREFCELLKTPGGVTLVEFMAPDGDVAYATLTTKDAGDAAAASRRIRIGEGYPIERHDGYSSPAFAIRTVQNAGVPYKFVVPSLSKTTTRP